MPVKIEHRENNLITALKFKVAIANRLIIEDVHRTSLPKTPMNDSKQLRRNVTKTVVPETYTGTIIWKVPYASYQERGMRADKTHIVKLKMLLKKLYLTLKIFIKILFNMFR